MTLLTVTDSADPLRSNRETRARDVTAHENVPLLLKAEEVAKMLGLGRTKVYDMMSSGELPVVRMGSAVRVNRQRLVKWIEENTQEAA